MSFTLSQIMTAEQDIKKSRFVAIAAPVAGIEAAKVFLAQQQDASATHQCWAWKINNQSRVNDDGEPGGTAGKPILAVIEGQQLDNVIVLVNRWYGGVKLGTGGLVRAYGSTAQLCLQQAEKVENVEKVAAGFFTGFSLWPRIQYYLNSLNIEPVKLEYQSNGIKLQFMLAQVHIEQLSRHLQDISAGQVQLNVGEEA